MSGSSPDVIVKNPSHSWNEPLERISNWPATLSKIVSPCFETTLPVKSTNMLSPQRKRPLPGVQPKERPCSRKGECFDGEVRLDELSVRQNLC